MEEIKNKWQISQFSKLTGVSVRTLHHYDHIGLLKASERQANGFRLYGKKDLQIMLQILSLKFLGFELLTIKGLLDKSIPAQELFSDQKKVINKNVERLTKASKILADVSNITGAVSLDLSLKLIEIHRLSHQLESLLLLNLLPDHFQEKAKQYIDRIYDALQQIGTICNNELLALCSVLSEEICHILPSAIYHQQNIVVSREKILSE